MKYMLVGKCSHGRPSVLSIKEFFDKLKLGGDINISHFDKKHIFIECSCKSDFIRLWMKLVWSIQGFSMRIFKWDSKFSPSKESPIAPVWIRIEGLPLYLFEGNSLCSISNAIGNPLRIDPRNINRAILSSARICVELDVSKPFNDAIWISIVDDVSKVTLDGFWVKVLYDMVPPYCKACSHIGHGMEVCKLKNAD
ncbi:hypothetical protein Leryth_022756 [Lithospermum erythrorhizon]|nr:hypothetical protein Leryth_022756 [Lithospermum erythrorhizon]